MIICYKTIDWRIRKNKKAVSESDTEMEMQHEQTGWQQESMEPAAERQTISAGGKDMGKETIE